MEIARDFYLQKLIDHKHNGLVKIVTGVRRCGKSYLLFTLFYNHLLREGVPEDHIIKVMLDDYGNKRLLDPDELYAYVKGQVKDGEPHYILLDEIQLVRDFESVVNGFLHIANVDIYVTGSNSKFLSSDIITEFRGRGDEIRVYPLSFAEYHSTLEKSTPFSKAWLRYATYGGMPLCLTMTTEADKAKYLKDLFATTYLADIINRNNLRGNEEINELTDILASSIGSLTNPLKLSNTFNSEKNIRLSPPTISAYLDYLQDAFLIEKTVRYDIKGKRYINTPSKYYFVDMGLRNAGYSVDVGMVETNVKTKGVSQRKQLEVDFVANMGNRRYYIQCAYRMPDEEKRKQEQASLLEIDDAFKKIVIVGDEVMTGYSEQGVLIASLSDFLLDLEKTLNR